MRKVSAAGLALIESFEKLRLNAYLDQGGVPTIGFGHTAPYVTMGMTITKQAAEAYLEGDLQRCEIALEAVKVPLNDNQYGALVAFIFNVGAGAFWSSTLLKLLNAGDYSGAAKEFRKWNKVKGAVSAGLCNRRTAEETLFRTPISPAA